MIVFVDPFPIFPSFLPPGHPTTPPMEGPRFLPAIFLFFFGLPPSLAIRPLTCPSFFKWLQTRPYAPASLLFFSLRPFALDPYVTFCTTGFSLGAGHPPLPFKDCRLPQTLPDRFFLFPHAPTEFLDDRGPFSHRSRCALINPIVDRRFYPAKYCPSAAQIATPRPRWIIFLISPTHVLTFRLFPGLPTDILFLPTRSSLLCERFSQTLTRLT